MSDAYYVHLSYASYMRVQKHSNFLFYNSGRELLILCYEINICKIYLDVKVGYLLCDNLFHLVKETLR